MVEDLEISVKLEIEWDVHEIVFPRSNLELKKQNILNKLWHKEKEQT